MTQTTLRVSALSGAAVLAALALSGCATKGFVRQQVATEDSRVSQVQDQASQAQDSANQAQGTAKDALDRANAAHKLAEGKFLFQVVLSDDSVKFPTDVHALSPEAQQRLSELADQLKMQNQNVYLEIQGHTDSTGTADYNMQLGEERAEAVRLFLNEQGVALNRMNTISYGETVPVASNKTKDGRAQNRRVQIVVLA